MNRIEESKNQDMDTGDKNLPEAGSGHCVRESQTAYQFHDEEYVSKRQGEYTLEDYYALSEEQRMELIDGVIYDMSAPTPVHQLLGTEIRDRLKAYIRRKKGECIPFVAPIDVQLDCDDRTILQPDILVVCDRRKIIKRCVYGAPDFVVEILSPSTEKKDSIIKLNKYMNAGVQEYWIVDPDKKTVKVYNFDRCQCPEVYGFDGKIPVSVFDGECEVDFAEIYDYVKFLYE